MFERPHRDDVFVAGGQPTVTYVNREELHVERSLARALATPNQIVSLAGPTKTGKTVLCRRVLGDREYIWIDGGELKSGQSVWQKICAELNVPTERSNSIEKSSSAEIGIQTIVTAGGSKLRAQSEGETHTVDGMGEALSEMIRRRVVLVIDDFHYLPADTRTEVLRNLKGGVFNGLKVLLLSVAHRVFDAITAETELTGRFISVSLPEWHGEELRKIPILGFAALRTHCPEVLIDKLVSECQHNPFLMQKFCWEICFDHSIETAPFMDQHTVDPGYDMVAMFVRIAQDAGLPIFEKLVAGPQSRKERMKRPLVSGGQADIYEATLLALAETGPKSLVSYEELRSKLNAQLSEMMPQKHEITSALKHLSSISMKSGADSAIDWDEEKREINLADPYLRFYLKWKISSHGRRDDNLSLR